jgi:hypothetical protein
MDLSVMKPLRPEEIFLVIKKALPFGGTLTIPTHTSIKNYPIKKLSLNSDDGLMIELFEEVKTVAKWHITIKLNYRNLTFHLDPTYYSFLGLTLTTKFPLEARALALRENERYVLPVDSEIQSSLYRIEKRGASSDINAHLVDVSQNGLGIIIHNADEEILMKNDHIWLKAINQIKLPRPIFGRIVYVKNRKYSDTEKDFRIGVVLSELIPEDVMTQLQELSSFVMSA